MFPNFHTHTEYCDGKGSPEDYIKEAVKLKLPALGFSGHAPVPFDSWWNMSENDFEKYRLEISFLKEKYKNKLEIYTAVEADFIRDLVKPSDFKDKNLDYIIGSVHYLYPENADKPYDFIISPEVFKEVLSKFYQNDIKKLIKDYYRQINLMIESGSVDIVGHLDQVQKFNKNNLFFDEKKDFYMPIVCETLDLISEKKLILEINTRGKLKKQLENFFPSTQIIIEAKKRDITFMLNADAHKPEELNSYFPEAKAYLSNLGINELAVFEKGKIYKKTVSKSI